MSLIRGWLKIAFILQRIMKSLLHIYAKNWSHRNINGRVTLQMPTWAEEIATPRLYPPSQLFLILKCQRSHLKGDHR